MPSFDLRPLSQEIIQEMGFFTCDLWNVKIESTVYGPFETESLKHYAAENPHFFNDASACTGDGQDWKPFYSFSHFQRRQYASENNSCEGPFWLLVGGQKVGPFSKTDLEQKLEQKEIARTDLFSADEGHSWQKIYQIPSFDRRNFATSELPHSPNETSFQKAKVEVVEKMESHQGTSQQDNLAQLAYLSQKKDKTVILNLEEITLKAIQETDMSKSLKWAIPAITACLLVFGVTAWYFVSPKADAPLADISDEAPMKVNRITSPDLEPLEQNSPAVSKKNEPQMNRRPASVPPMHPSEHSRKKSNFVHESEFPTHVETHENNDRSPSNDDDIKEKDQDREPADQDREPVEPKEDVVDSGEDSGSLDKEMNREPANHDPAIDPPVTEEPAADY